MMEQRLIDANALKEKISSLAITVAGIMAGKDILRDILLEYRLTVLRIIEEQPTVDAVPVVRCKDCEYRLYPTGMCMNPMAMGFDALEPTDSDFCSRGKRRDSDG